MVEAHFYVLTKKKRSKQNISLNKITLSNEYLIMNFNENKNNTESKENYKSPVVTQKTYRNQDAGRTRQH